jgi:hypothetical protein
VNLAAVRTTKRPASIYKEWLVNSYFTVSIKSNRGKGRALASIARYFFFFFLP